MCLLNLFVFLFSPTSSEKMHEARAPATGHRLWLGQLRTGPTGTDRNRTNRNQNDDRPCVAAGARPVARSRVTAPHVPLPRRELAPHVLLHSFGVGLVLRQAVSFGGD